jgi:hypothetical protein
MRPAGARISGRAQGCLRAGRTKGQAHGNLRSAPAIRHVAAISPIKPNKPNKPNKASPPEYQSPGERQPGPVVMMCDRRYCGCMLRGGNLIQFTVAAVAALALAGAAATVLQDLLDALLIGLPVLIAGIATGFGWQVRSFRKQAIRSGAARTAPAPGPRAPAAPAPGPAPAIQSLPRRAPDIWALEISALDVSPAAAAAPLASEPDAAPG